MFNNVEEARSANHVAVGIIDEYVESLLRKDRVILDQNKVIEDLQNKLSRLMGLELPKGGECSE